MAGTLKYESKLFELIGNESRTNTRCIPPVTRILTFLNYSSGLSFSSVATLLQITNVSQNIHHLPSRSRLLKQY